jgi:[protein-PII] uridylyltransferase
MRRLKSEVRRLVPRTHHKDEVDAHFSNLPDRYFIVHTPREIAADITLVHRFMWNQLVAEDRALEPAISWNAEPDRGYSVLKICTWDRPRLFSLVAGAIAAARLNILGARVFSRPDGPVFDTLSVHDLETGKPATREARERFEQLLTGALAGKPVDFEKLIASHKPSPPLYRPIDQDLIPTRVSFDNHLMRDRTLLEIEAEDRPGLLFDLTRVLADLDLDISFARINTEQGAAIDTFHVTDRDGRKVTGNERLQIIEFGLRAVLQPRHGEPV